MFIYRIEVCLATLAHTSCLPTRLSCDIFWGGGLPCSVEHGLPENPDIFCRPHHPQTRMFFIARLDCRRQHSPNEFDEHSSANQFLPSKQADFHQMFAPISGILWGPFPGSRESRNLLAAARYTAISSGKGRMPHLTRQRWTLPASRHPIIPSP